MHAAAAYLSRHDRASTLPTHRHRGGYAALVLDGSHVETSIDGAWRCEPGTLVLHPPWHAHGNRFGGAKVRVLNLELPANGHGCDVRVLRVHHLKEARETLARAPERIEELAAAATAVERFALPDWQSAFLRELRDSDAPVGAIAAELGVSFAHASRGFKRTHGMSPQAARRELCWRRALALLAGNASLAAIAAQAGFADQSHLTRLCRLHTGATPSALRREIKSVQDAGSPAMMQSRPGAA
ncbi:helix-turn-helix domain-containing protein [Luteimonas suaedae]|uniref:helix-turn-helix domain-containing protein n=1 Tax=Luteimonas suaedae TaxID=2605430 RepID=UPI0011EDA8CD|nr:AraC family transcriptional regulator [Luteimonas suaedae]